MHFFPLIVLITSVTAVSVVNPLDDQLPLIARVGNPFSWSFSPETFNSSTNSDLSYSTSPLPSWLMFDTSTRTFSGTPSASDQGNPEITVTANDSDSTASSHFTFCVTKFPPLVVNVPITQQFHDGNPSLSSVFLLFPNSALATSHPALRVPSKWSFSIGFQGNTFNATDNLYYYVLLSDGSAPPDWIQFDQNTITIDGVSPSTPQNLTLALHGSDQAGYTSTVLPFNLIVADHEVSQSSSSLPTINITAASSCCQSSSTSLPLKVRMQ